MPLTFDRLETAGRLGNQLWQIAATAGVARRMNMDVALPWWSYRPFFSCPDEWWGPEGTKTIDVTHTRHVRHISRWHRLYLQDFSLFADIADEVRFWFRPSQSAFRAMIADPVCSWLQALDEPGQDFTSPYNAIALHVRRGDTVVNGPTIQPCAPIQFYRDALGRLDPTLPVVVFSDDAEWCAEVLVPDLEQRCDRYDTYYVCDHGPGRSHIPDEYRAQAPSDWLDLQLMASCRHHVISNSSYAWWGAFLSGDPQPLYPSRWFGPKLIATGCDHTRMIPPGWQEVEVTEAPAC